MVSYGAYGITPDKQRQGRPEAYNRRFSTERPTRIELASSAWKAVRDPFGDLVKI
jgi:hypothetical protein